MVYVMAVISVVLGTTGQTLFKFGLSQQEGALDLFSLNLLRTLFQPIVFLGFVCYGVSALIWLSVLSRLPLSVAYPILSLNFVLILVTSAAILGEPVSTTKVAGTALIMGGIVLIAR